MDTPRIAIASTVAPHKLGEPGGVTAWLRNVETMRAQLNQEIPVACMIETDARGLAPFGDIPETYPASLIARLDELGGDYWSFRVEMRPGEREEVTSGNRLIRICTGRNLAVEWFWQLPVRHTHLLFLDTDVQVPAEVPRLLLEVDRPVVFARIPAYVIDGPPAPHLPGDCRAHWSSLGCVLVRRDVLQWVAFHTDPDNGLSDDPTFARDAQNVPHGLAPWDAVVTRHDAVAHHVPPLVALEHRGTDRQLRKEAR